MSEFYELTPLVYPSPAKPNPDEVLRGDWWSVLYQDGQYIVDYISSELIGRVKQLVISKKSTNISNAAKPLPKATYWRAMWVN